MIKYETNIRPWNTNMFNDTYQDLAEFARPLSFLQRDGVLTPENQDVLANHANPLNLALTLSFLQRGGILTLENRAAVTNHVNSLDLASAISSL